MKKRLFCALIMMILCVCALSVSAYAAEITAEGQCTESITWTLDSDGLLTISGSGDMPQYSGTFEDENFAPWYEMNEEIQSIVIGSGVTSIGNYAFWQSAASTVVMADTVTEMGEYAFAQSSNLTAVTLSEGLTAISNYAFQECSALSEITLPDSVTRIGTCAFGTCENLSTITIPANVTEIGSCAFISCSKLASVYFEGDVPSVFMDAAFLSTSQSLVFYYYEGASGWMEGEWKDSYNNTYTTVELSARPANNTSGKCNDNISWTLDENGLLTVSGSGEMPNYEDFIDKWNKDNIRSIVIENEITTIGEGAFRDCSALCSVSFPTSLKMINTRAFQNCDSLTTLSLNEGLEFIGECAFEWCDGFTSITLPDSLKYLGEKAFAECNKLAAVEIGSGLEEIGANPFCLCPELYTLSVHADNPYFAAEKSILYSKDKTTLYADLNVTFHGPDDYTVPDGVVRIADRAYSNCSTLETVTFPASLKTVGDRAFQNCENLTTINFNDDLETIEGWAFEYCSSLTEITLPAKVKNVGNRAFQYCTGLTKVTFPAVLNTIGDNVFDECPNLVSATFEGNVPSNWSDDVFGTENVNNALVISYYASYTNWTTPTWIAPDNTVYKTRELDNPNPPAASDSYSAAISADREAVLVNETVKITVTADKAFSAAELVLSYDKNLLTFVGFEPASDVQASVDNGTITLVDFGSEKTAYVFTFTAKDTGIAEFALTSAAFGTAEDAATEDLIEAAITTGSVSVEIGMPDVAVSLPTDILSGNSTVAYGADYTFYTTNNGAYYNYTVSAAMGGENATVIDNKDGSYTVENVTADLVITASRTAKTFNITFTTNSGAYLPSNAVITYGYDISVDVPASAGYANTVTSAAYANGGNVSYTLSNGVLCIAGTAVTDDIVIVIDQVRTEITVTLNGSAASDVEEFDPTASVGEDYVLTVNKDSMYNYTVKITVNGQEIDFAAVENTYIIEGSFITASVEQIVITVDKSLNVASLTTSATEYLTLKDDETLWLVKVEAEKIDGKVYYYNEEALFWSDVHNAYCTVIESETKPEINADTLTLVDGTATELTSSMDINRSGKVDANDAQFVYNMYNKMYEGVTDAVTAEKYLRADTNGDGKIDVNDALAIVNAILKK